MTYILAGRGGGGSSIRVLVINQGLNKNIMGNKIIIDNPATRLSDQPEKELDSNSVIRFEVGDRQLTIKIYGDVLSVYKMNFKTGDDTIIISPAASNRIYIK